MVPSMKGPACKPVEDSAGRLRPTAAARMNGNSLVSKLACPRLAEQELNLELSSHVCAGLK